MQTAPTVRMLATVASWIVVNMMLLSIALAAENDSRWQAVHQRVADLLLHGRIAESEKVLEESIKAARQRGETSAGLAEALNDLGTLYHDSGRFVEAERAYEESLSHWTRIPGTSPEMGTPLRNLAGLRLAQGRLSEAEKLYIDAARLLTYGYGLQSPELATVLCGLADVYWETRRYTDARHAGERALALLENTRYDSQIGVALFLLAKIALKEHREVEAERLVRRAIELWRTSLGPQHPTYISGLTSLAVLLSGKDPSEAIRLFRESLAMAETQLGPDHVFTGYTLVLYARHLDAHGRKREGRNLRRRGEAILARHSRENVLGHTLDIKAFQQPNAR